jgi:asparagine synthase (glutamine-hydrolysing)
MAWGLEARVPFLDKAFLEVAMNIDPRNKMFSKGADQQVDEDGRPKMEKVLNPSLHAMPSNILGRSVHPA